MSYLHKTIVKLGHCPQLGLAELIQNNLPIENQDGKWAVLESNPRNIHTQDFGSLIYALDVLAQWPKDIKFEDVQEDVLKQLATIQPTTKKLGLSVFRGFNERYYLEFKKLGYKKINQIYNLPNAGHLRQGVDWLIFFRFRDRLLLGKLINYHNQALWSTLDQKLPAADMKRGIINFKLARSLHQLSNHKHVWDPFCGQGRNLVAALDKDTDWICSDLDSKCLPDVTNNYQSGLHYFQKFGFQTKAKLSNVFQLDITNFHRDDLNGDFFDQPTSVVTEGYLGFNFNRHPKPNEAKEELNKIFNLWEKAIQNFEKVSNVKEIIFCLPFYPSLKEAGIMPNYQNLVQDTSFKFINLDPESTGNKAIFYSRSDSRVGHMVLKIAKRD